MESAARGGTARRGATTRARGGAARARRIQRNWRRRRKQQPLGGQGGGGRRGRQRRETRKKVERERYRENRGLAGATPGNPPLRSPTRRKRGAAIGRGRRKGRKRETGGKIRPEKTWECGATTRDARPLEWPMSPPKWSTRRGPARPPEWQKPTRVLPRSGRRSRVATGRQHPWSGLGEPGGQNSRREHSERGRTKGGQTGAGRGRNPPHQSSNQDAGI